MPARFASKDSDAVTVGALGCHKGGRQRAEKTPLLHLSKIGKHGALTRWDPKYKKSFRD